MREPDPTPLIPPDPDTPVWVRVGTLLDGTSTQPLRDAHLVYDGRSILYIGESAPPAEHLRPGQREPDAHLAGHTALPGLVESHAHLFLEGAELDFEKRKAYLQQSPDELLARAVERAERLLAFGITAVRDAGDKDGVGLALSARYRTGEPPAMPYLDSPGAAVHHRGRYGSFMGAPLEDHDSPEACVASRVAAGADRIKLIPTGIINFKKGAVTAAPQMSAEEVRALVNAAKQHGRQTFAHASGTDGIGNALAGGVDSVEHAFFVTPDQLATMRDTNTAWIPTFAPVQVQVDEAERMGWDETIVANLQRILDGHAESLQRAVAMGVTLIAGSDAGSCGVGHAVGFLAELALMEKAGMPTLAVLNAATGIPAGRLGFHDPIGRLAPGCKARFILTRHDPLDSVTTLQRDKLVLFDGQLHAAGDAIETQGL